MLERIKEAYPKSFPGDLAALRLIDLYMGRGEEHQASRQIQQFLAHFPSHAQSSRLSEMLDTLHTKLKSNQSLACSRAAAVRQTLVIRQRRLERRAARGRNRG